jgi:SAM-dependent methyltransferase
MPETLKAEPKKFFMSLWDVAFWIRSAKTDASFEKLRSVHGSQKAFDLLYKEKRDPFGSINAGFRYQDLKYERLISFLPKRHYSSALDIGCGLGPFTRKLSPYAKQVLGVDLSEAAILEARELSTSQTNTRFEQCDARELSRIGERFDLIAVLDVLYYLSPLSDELLGSIARQIEGLLAPNGVILLVNHFFFGIDSQSRQTRRIHDVFLRETSLKIISEHKRPFFLASALTNEPLTPNAV